MKPENMTSNQVYSFVHQFNSN